MNEQLKKWDLTQVEDEFNLIKGNNEFVVMDIETTGFSPEKGSEIIQIAAARVVNLEIVETMATFVKPLQEIPTLITDLTGITNEDVENAIDSVSALQLLSDFIGDGVVVCHNAQFDWLTFLKPLMEQASISADQKYVCTFRTFQKAIRGLGKGAYTNETMSSIFGYTLTGAHQADADVEATAHSLMGLKKWFEDVDMDEVKEEKEKRELAKPDTPVEIKSVNFWEKEFSSSGKMKRQYIRLEGEGGKGTVFYDLIQKGWRNKDFPTELNFRSVERDVLGFLGLSSVQELAEYQG